MRDRVVVVRRVAEDRAMAARPVRRQVVREVVRGPPILEERRMGPPPRRIISEDLPPRGRIIEEPLPPRRIVEPVVTRRHVAAAPPPLRREYVGDGGRPKEQWELDLLRPQPGIVIESVREVNPGDPKYDHYLHGQGYQRVDAGRRAPEVYDRPPVTRVREREYMDRPTERVERVVRSSRPAGDGWRDNFRGGEYYDDDIY